MAILRVTLLQYQIRGELLLHFSHHLRGSFRDDIIIVVVEKIILFIIQGFLDIA
jgi:hypothetical protein